MHWILNSQQVWWFWPLTLTHLMTLMSYLGQLSTLIFIVVAHVNAESWHSRSVADGCFPSNCDGEDTVLCSSMVWLLFSSRLSETWCVLVMMQEIWLLWTEHAYNGWTVYWRWWRILFTYTFQQKPRPVDILTRTPSIGLLTESKNS